MKTTEKRATGYRETPTLNGRPVEIALWALANFKGQRVRVLGLRFLDGEREEITLHGRAMVEFHNENMHRRA